VEEKQLANKENNERILGYIGKHPNETEEKIAEDLKLNIIDVLDSLTDLEKQGRVKGQPD
jgi:DNA-binding MarR family transcriptional regulator